MLTRIQDFYQKFLQTLEQEDDGQDMHGVRLAATALMVEVMRVDDDKSEIEIETILNASMQKFGIERHEAEALMELAADELANATDYHQFTSLINRHCELPQKLRMVEYLWQVAFADGRLDMYEEHVVRKVADLIYVPHKDFIRLKEKVRQSAQR